MKTYFHMQEILKETETVLFFLPCRQKCCHVKLFVHAETSCHSKTLSVLSIKKIVSNNITF